MFLDNWKGQLAHTHSENQKLNICVVKCGIKIDYQLSHLSRIEKKRQLVALQSHFKSSK